MNSYFPLVDVLRFLAAFAVMCFHYFSHSLIGKSGIFSLFSSYGMLGVQLFFIISGFVIFFSLGKDIKDYTLGRFLRLYPLFWFLCTITYLVTLIPSSGDHLPFHIYLYNLLIVNNGKTAFMIDGSYWTLTIEILFYFFIGLFVYFFDVKRVLYFYIGWLSISLAAFYFGFYHLLLSKVFLARQAPYFIFGGLIAYLYSMYKVLKKEEVFATVMTLILSAVAPLYISSVLASDPLPRTNAFGIYDHTGQLIVFGLFIVFLIVVYISQFITNKHVIAVAKNLGLITYPLYLIHQKIGSIILGKSFGMITLSSIITATGMITVSYLVGKSEAKWRKTLYKKISSKMNKLSRRDTQPC